MCSVCLIPFIWWSEAGYYKELKWLAQFVHLGNIKCLFCIWYIGKVGGPKMTALKWRLNILSFFFSSPIKNVFIRCQSYSDRYELSNFSVFTRKCEFYYWQQILSVVFLDMKGSFYSYFDMSARQPNPNNHKFVYLALSGKDESLRKNCLVQLTTILIWKVM